MGNHKAKPDHRKLRRKRVACRVCVVLMAFGVAYFVSEWIVTGAAFVSLAHFVVFADNEGGWFG